MNEKAKKILAYAEQYMRENNITPETVQASPDPFLAVLTWLPFTIETGSTEIYIPFEPETEKMNELKKVLSEANVFLESIGEYLYNLKY